MNEKLHSPACYYPLARAGRWHNMWRGGHKKHNNLTHLTLHFSTTQIDTRTIPKCTFNITLLSSVCVLSCGPWEYNHGMFEPSARRLRVSKICTRSGHLMVLFYFQGPHDECPLLNKCYESGNWCHITFMTRDPLVPRHQSRWLDWMLDEPSQSAISK